MLPHLADLRFALRSFRRSPGHALTTVVVLAIGVAAVTTMFSTFDSVVLRPLPFPGQDRLVWLWKSSHQVRNNSVSAEDYRDYRERVQAFQALAAFDVFQPRVVVTGAEEPQRVRCSWVSASLFETLGVLPELGRAFRADEEHVGAGEVVILSHGFWRRWFGEDPSAVGSTLDIDGRPHEIVGVMPRGFDYPVGVELWHPLRWEEGYAQGRGNNNFFVVGRLARDVTLIQADAQVERVARSLAESFPDTNAGWSARLEPLHEVLFGSLRPIFLILMGIVSLVPLVACANAAALGLVRGISRRGELATRRSLGASWGRILGQLVTEGLLLALIGGGIGLLLAWGGVGLVRSLGPPDLPRLDTVGIDGRMVGFTLLVSLLTVPLIAAAPALRAHGISVAEALRGGDEQKGERRQLRTLTALVVAQVTACLVLLVATGLLYRSLLGLESADPGFRVESVLCFETQLSETEAVSDEAVVALWDRLTARIRAVPGVASVATTTQTPFGGGMPYNDVWPEDRPPDREGEWIPASRKIVSEEYFSVLGIPMRSGRPFMPTDRPGSRRVMVLSQLLAEELFPDREAVGQAVHLWDQPFEVVGVAAQVLEQAPGAVARPVFFLSTRQVPPRTLSVVVRTTGEPMEVAGSLREAVREVDRNLPLSPFTTLEARFHKTLAQPRFRATLVGLFGVISAVLSTVGLYGVLAYLVSRRKRELSIRLAVGALPWKIVLQVVRRGMFMALAGVGLGWLIGGLAVRAMRGLLYGVAPFDPLTFLAVSMVLIVVSIGASLLPAWRAARVDPVESLRSE